MIWRERKKGPWKWCEWGSQEKQASRIRREKNPKMNFELSDSYLHDRRTEVILTARTSDKKAI